MADIGTDHAYLPIWLVQSGQIGSAIASDVSPASLDKARRAVCSRGLEKSISLRLGSGLKVLSPKEVQVVIIAGLGPQTIASLIAESPGVAADTEKFLLQPMHDPGRLRRAMYRAGIKLTAESLVRERDRFYVIMEAIPGQMPTYGPHLLEIGPFLIAGRDPLLKDYMHHRLATEERIRRQIGTESGKAAKRRRRLASDRIALWEEILGGDCCP